MRFFPKVSFQYIFQFNAIHPRLSTHIRISRPNARPESHIESRT
ncbi:hypothetical protein [Sediminimonas sp.]|nr:hypothetical protein [Sediminimonas sp.]